MLQGCVDVGDLGNVLSASGQAQRDQPQIFCDPVSLLSFGRKEGTAEQNRRHGRRYHPGSPLPAVDESSVPAHQGEQEGQRPFHIFHSPQHETAQRSVYQGSRRMWISRSWRPVQLSDQTWVSLNGHAEPWKTMSSLRQYEQAGCLSQIFGKLSKTEQKRALKAELDLPPVLATSLGCKKLQKQPLPRAVLGQSWHE